MIRGLANMKLNNIDLQDLQYRIDCIRTEINRSHPNKIAMIHADFNILVDHIIHLLKEEEHEPRTAESSDKIS